MSSSSYDVLPIHYTVNNYFTEWRKKYASKPLIYFLVFQDFDFWQKDII